MKISVVIPTYNSAKVIGATLESVLKQTLQPDEILVLDDGSTDETVSLLNAYQPRVTVIQQKNRGVAQARNELAARAGGDLVAFLDHDDLWHPGYLESQRRMFQKHPQAVAFFAGHVDFKGYGNYEWPAIPAPGSGAVELIEPLGFLKQYNERTGAFGSMSYCCVPKRVLVAMGAEPFRVSGVDDSHFCMLLPLYGPVVFAPTPLAVYRLTRGAQSADRLKSLRLWVSVFELIEGRYAKNDDARMRQEFRLAFASKRRWHGKLLMGAGDAAQARREFVRSMNRPGSPGSLAKSFMLWFLSRLPGPLQPIWLESSREAEVANASSRKFYAVR